MMKAGRKQKAESRKQKTQGRRQEAENRRQEAVDRSSKFNRKSGTLIKIKISENLDMEEDELKVMNPSIKVLLSSGYTIDQKRLVGLLFRGV